MDDDELDLLTDLLTDLFIDAHLDLERAVMGDDPEPDPDGRGVVLLLRLATDIANRVSGIDSAAWGGAYSC